MEGVKGGDYENPEGGLEAGDETTLSLGVPEVFLEEGTPEQRPGGHAEIARGNPGY